MTQAEPPTPDYERLSPRFAVGRQRMYLAPDHLLLASGRINESYKRLYFKDIVCITLVRTRSAGGSLVVGIALCVAALLMLISGDFGWKIFGGLILPLGLWAATIAALRYPSSEMMIHTRIQQVRSDAVPKHSRARELLNRIEARILEHQGGPAQPESTVTAPASVSPAPEGATAPVPPQPAEGGAAP